MHLVKKLTLDFFQAVGLEMTTHLGKLKDAAVEKNILVSYLLLMNTMIGLDKQQKEFEKSNGKLTKSRKKPRAKGMR